MAYPRRCPVCGGDYQASGRPDDLCHVTLQADPGGTPSPSRPALPGRLLTLHCLLCRGAYPWDYFGDRLPAGVAPAPRPRVRAAPRRPPLRLPGSPPRA